MMQELTVAWNLEICYCVDNLTGEKIPLTEKAVLGDDDYPQCFIVSDDELSFISFRVYLVVNGLS